ncbi:MAG: hypothetical protein KBS77_02620 [Bacteroidales bacterium]|nr:hypothetical protein [Candidatus Colicola faecequi]
MRKFFITACLAIAVAGDCFLAGALSLHSRDARALKKELSRIPGVHDVHFIFRPPYDDCLLFTYDQPVEYMKDSAGNLYMDASGNPVAADGLGYFRQRVMLGYQGREAGTVMVTEGYSIERYLNPERPSYQNELAKLFGLNEVLVEHRYFMPSAPLKSGKQYTKDQPKEDFELEWDHLTTANAASDHHRVYRLLKDILRGGWVSTGASKGGLTSVMYACYYPEDMNVHVPYVAPFCVTQDDPRMADFLLNTVGTEEQRAHHNGLVVETLRRKAVFWDRFVQMCDSAEWEFQLPLDTIYQLAALDMPVGLWMYYPDTLELPALDCPDDTLWHWLEDHLGPDGLSCDRMAIPYDIQAAKELGCYCYDVDFCQGEGMTLDHGDGLWQITYLPQDRTFDLDTTMHHSVEQFLRTTTVPILCINGQNDPWTSVGFSPLFEKDGWNRDSVVFHAHDNLYFYTLPRGNHGSKIEKFEEPVRSAIMDQIRHWMDLN